MDPARRNALIILLLLLVLAVVIFVWSAANKDQSSGASPKDRAKDVEFSSIWTGAATWLQGFGPKLDLGKTKFAVLHGETKKVVVKVPAVDQNGPEYRTGRFRLAAGAAGHLLYEDDTPGLGKDDKDQSLDFPGPERSRRQDPMSGSILVHRGGGTLTLSCAGASDCEFDLQ